MAQSQEIEKELVKDFTQWLTANLVAPVPVIYRKKTKRDLEQATAYPAIALSAEVDPNLFNGNGEAVGNYRADIMIECQTYIEDDQDKSALDNLSSRVLDVVNIVEAVADLNTLSEFNTYKSLIMGASIIDEERNVNIKAYPFTAIMLPSNAK